jgi:hypothetical protein
MSNSCSIKLQVDKLPKIINKVEYFLFRAIEQKGMNLYKISQQPRTAESMEVFKDIKSGKITKEKLESLIGKKYAKVLTTASQFKDLKAIGTDAYRIAQMVYLLDTVKNTMLPSYINEYIENAKSLREDNELEGADYYEKFAANLQNLVTLWDQIIPNFLVYSEIFKVKTKFKMDDETGLADLNDIADDEKKMLNKMVFDNPSNETDPVDDIDKSVELFIRSIPVEGAYDEYGYTVSIDYSSFIRKLLTDTENTISLDEVISRLEKNKTQVPEYQFILDKLAEVDSPTAEQTQFRINFRNSFAKAFVPIRMVSIERLGTGEKVFKTIEAAGGKSNAYTRIIESNFTVRGMEVSDGTKIINLAHNENGVWVLTEEDLPKIKAFLESKLDPVEYKNRRVEFLKALGFDFSPITEKFLKESSYLNGKFDYIYDHLIKAIELNPQITKPLNTVKVKVKNLPELEKDNKKWWGQSRNINEIVELELKNNPDYNNEKSSITAEGTRVYSIQLHNNFTVLNKYFSDAETFPDLESILKEPSMFWMDPRNNPSIRSSYYLNSLFFFDPNDTVNFGKRRRVTKAGTYSSTEGEHVKLTIIGNNGLQYKNETSFEKEGSSSTSLNELDKLVQDMQAFFAAKNNYAGMLRLGDKSTDLGINLNYGLDVVTGQPLKNGKPLEGLAASLNIFTTDRFKSLVKNSLKDFLELRYLAEKGFFKSEKDDKGNVINSGLSMAQKNALSTWSYFDGILNPIIKEELDSYIKQIAEDPESTIEEATIGLAGFDDLINNDIVEYFNKKTKSFYNKLNEYKTKLGMSSYDIIGQNDLIGNTAFYLANSFITDLDQMKIFFGDAIFFKDFHKRASKDSATGVFAVVDDTLLKTLNDFGNTQGYGANTNLSGRLLIERLYQQKKITKEERDQILLKQTLQKSFRSAVLKDVDFNSKYATKILENVEKLKDANGLLSEEMRALYDESLKNVISNKYTGTEADGQGKCTFDFYRVMSILTSQWLPEQEEVYKKIVEYNHYDELASEETDDTKRAEYIQKRDAVGYNPIEPVYFPPKKFQYSGPMGYSRIIDGKQYNMAVPIFDKFSLQPLIPTVTKKTADHELLRKMEYNGIGYVKFESGSKAEKPTDKDEFYSGYDQTNPEVRKINKFNTTDKFKSEQELFFNHFKEQVRIDAEVHDHAIFGSQIRKLILMNLDKPEFKLIKEKYAKYLGELAEIEKVSLFNELGIKKVNNKLKIDNFPKLVDYFLNEISKKDQDSNVKKALKYDEATGKFDIPLDASVQAQVIEGIIISAINNRIVRYKTNGSMLIQMAITGSESTKFNKDSSVKALETYGNTELNYYDITEEFNGKLGVSKMDVKIALTGQWLNLLKLNHPDGRKIESIERLNDALNNAAWKSENEKSLTMTAYRIPTQGRNFLDVMLVKQFLPAAVGDAIVMPSEVVIKSGSDFDIDKMFVFYPNLTSEGKYMQTSYTDADIQNPDKYNEIKGSIQNRLYEIMQEVILHPANYIELVTPSENFHILPILDDIFEKLGLKGKGQERKKTDYKNTEILERELNIKKFLSLLKGKNDLGIAAVANTFNAMFQLANASSNPKWLTDNKIRSFFDSKYVTKEGNKVRDIDYSSIFDEDGVLKSEFFSEFINAFVDVAKDDYVFAANVVTELSPIIFYMKFAGMSSKKILYFINQPGIKAYTKNLAMYQNMAVKASGVLRDQNGNTVSPRTLAMRRTLSDLGYYDVTKKELSGTYNRDKIQDYLGLSNMDSDFSKFFTEEMLFAGIQNDNKDIKTLSEKGKLVQISMLLELENLKAQSNSVTEAQKFLNFDTNPFSSSFDVFARAIAYGKGLSGSSILSPQTLKNIRDNSIISPLNVGKTISDLLSELFPVRNSIEINTFLLNRVLELKNNLSNKEVVSDDDMLKVARTAKNDYINFILQNNIGNSKEGMKFFHETFETDKGFNEYLLDLVKSNKLIDMFTKIKKMEHINEELGGKIENVFAALSDQYPFIKNIFVERGEKNMNLSTFKIIENSSNTIEKESVIAQFEELVNLPKPEDKPIVDFFKNLALYSIFQSGMNKSDVSFTDITPIGIINKLYGYAMTEQNNQSSKMNAEEKRKQLDTFYGLFMQNNPSFYGNNSDATLTREKSSKGKWYSTDTKLTWKVEPTTPAPKAVITPSNTQATVVRYDGTFNTKQAARNREGVYVMTPNEGDNIPGVNTEHNFGNPWNHEGYQGKIKTATIEEAVANYEKWLRKEDFLDVAPERREWILSVINAGRLDNKNLLYFASGFRSHADALADFVNERSKESIQAVSNVKNLFTVKPIQAADKKAVAKASIATQFIGFGEGIVGSSTETYRQQAGKYANTGNYSANDVIFVSVPGKRGDAAIAKREQDKTIKEAIKAVEAGATILVDNKAYTEASTYNIGEQRLLKNLEDKGYTYSEITVDGQLIGTWSKLTTQPSTSVKVISQADVDAYHAYLQKSNDKAPKEFFTSNTTFKEFYNTNTGKREKAPQSSKWILKDNGLYDLIDKDSGELYIEDVDLRTGIKIVEPTQPSTSVKEGTLSIQDVLKEYTLEELKQGVNLRSLQDKVLKGDEETIKTAYNYLKANEKVKLLKKDYDDTVERNKEITRKVNHLTYRINETIPTKVGDVLDISNNENISDYKAKLLEITRNEKGAVLKIITAKKKEYTLVVTKEGKTKTGYVTNFVFESSKEDVGKLRAEKETLKSQLVSTKDYFDYDNAFKQVWKDYFEPSQPSTSVETSNTTEGKIAEWIETEVPWTIETPASELATMYEKEKLSGESIEEFLNRLSCNGKLK